MNQRSDPCREFLNSASFDNKELKRLRLKINDLREALLHVTPAYSDMPKGHTEGARDSQLAALADTELYYEQRLREFSGRVKAVEEFIDRIENGNQRVLLRLRYIDCMKFEDIADVIGFSLRQTHRIHGDALQSARKLYGIEGCKKQL